MISNLTNPLKVIIRYLRIQFYIHEEDSIDTIEKEIYENILFKGVNIWVLHFAILIACIGLNIDSKTAIIGAMIISPVMGPAYGISYALVRFDLLILKMALRNFSIIILISILTSSIYFFLTPLNIHSHEIDSYSSASIFDILIAFIGGMAGFLAITRKFGDRYIVGISIATSCIPPLCASGYGIAHLDWRIFLGGIYLFLINVFFIFLGSYLMAKFLKIPSKVPKLMRLRYKILGLLVLVSIPSIWLSYQTIRKQINEYNANQYLEYLENKHPFVVLKKNYDLPSNTLHIYTTGKISDDLFHSDSLQKFDLSDIRFEIHKIE